MRCAWKEFLSILPRWMQQDVDTLGRESLQELRLRCNAPPQLIMGDKTVCAKGIVSEGDLNFCINAASRYSPWNAATAARGYLTAPGGHRIGLCGAAVYQAGQLEGIKQVTSLCIRVARDHPGISQGAPLRGSVLILGAPGWGKTTLLRDLIRSRSSQGISVSVVDERGELFPTGFPVGKCTDILTGCRKPEGILMLLRTMGPACVAVDEITQPEDCDALMQAFGCGVDLLATAHAGSMEDLQRRPVYRRLLEAGLFDTVLVLHRDKSWRMERMKQWNSSGSVRC